MPNNDNDYVMARIVTRDQPEEIAEFTQNQIKVAIARAKRLSRKQHVDAEIQKGFVSRIFNW